MKLKNLKNFPKKELHKHNSIPNYIDCIDEGCVTCIKNQAIDEIGEIEIEVDVDKLEDIISDGLIKYGSDGHCDGYIKISEIVNQAIEKGEVLR